MDKEVLNQHLKETMNQAAIDFIAVICQDPPFMRHQGCLSPGLVFF